MNAASLAKLGLRMIAAYLLFLVLPARIELTILGVMTEIRQMHVGSSNADSLANAVMTSVQTAFLVIFPALLWMKMAGLVSALLPVGANPEPDVDYDRWQSLGLLFIGGLLAVKAVLYFIYWLSHGGSGLFFNVIAAVMLMGDGHVLLGVLSRLTQTDWRAAWKRHRTRP